MVEHSIRLTPFDTFTTDTLN